MASPVLRVRILWPAACRPSSDERVSRKYSSPLAVRVIPRIERSNSATPNASSRARMCRLIADSDVPRSSAARAMVPSRATASKASSVLVEGMSSSGPVMGRTGRSVLGAGW